MAKPYRDDQRRVMITLSAARYDELKATARAYSLSMTGIINALIGDYLKAERNADDMTGAGLSARVDSIEKRLATLSAILADKRGRKRRPKQTETDLTDDAPGGFGGVPHDHGDSAAETSTENKIDDELKASTVNAAQEKEPAPTVNALELFAAEDPAPIMETEPETKSTSTGNDGATSRPEPGAAIMETETPKGATTEPPRHTHDDPHARAASIAQRAPERVTLAASLAKETTGTRRHEMRDDYRDGGNLRQRTPLEMRLEETKRRAAAYALHGGGLRPSFAIQGAY